MKRLLLILTILGLNLCELQAQRMPFFTHYYDNPYLYNPAYAGYDKHSVFYLTHRQQWLGVEGAPVSTQLSFHSPIGNANPIFVGGDIANDRLGAINHTAFKFSLAYMLPLSVEHEHYLKTAFSAGLGMHSFDLGNMDIGDDPVLQAAMGNRSYLDGRFGFRYHNRGFNLSVALPHLFAPPPLSEAGIGNVTFDELSRIIFSTHFRINFNPQGSMALEPTVLYHYARDADHQLEALGIFRYKESFWVGGGYQQQGGFAGTAGLRVKNLKLSYAYATAGSEISAYGMGTHEIQLGLIIGKKKEILKRKPRLSTRNSIDVMPDEDLLKKHAKSRQKARKKDKKKTPVPDRKRVDPPAQQQQEEPQILVIENNKNPAEAETVPAKKAENQPRETEVKTAREAAQKPNAAPAQKTKRKEVDYSKLSFESFEGESSADENNKPRVAPPAKKPATSKADPTPAGQTVQTQKGKAESDAAEAEEKVSWGEDWEEKTRESHPLEMKKGFYIIAGTFSTEENARRQAQSLKAKGLDGDLGYHTEKQYYYVHIFSSASKDEALQMLEPLKQKSGLDNAWILSVEE